MDRLNHILWLKARLTFRTLQSSTAGVIGTVLLISFSFLAMMPSVWVLTAHLSALPPDSAAELAHAVTFAAYAAWLAMPVMGYRINEFLDLRRLMAYPVAPVHLFTGSILAQFLDASALLVYPFLGGLLVGLWPGIVALPLALTVLASFAVHTFAASQALLLVLVHLMNLRRLAEALAILIPLMVLGAFVGHEAQVWVYDPRTAWLTQAPPSTFLSFLPAGVAANALLDLRAGHWAGALYWTAVSVALALVTLAGAAAVLQRLVASTGAEPASGTRRREGRVGGRLARFLHEKAEQLGPVPRQVLAVAQKEWHLLIREPQVRASLSIFAISTFILCFFAYRQGHSETALIILPPLAASSMFILGAILMNGLALEREGLRFLLAAPVSPLGIVLGKNLAQWVLTLVATTLPMLVMGLLLDVPRALLGALLFGTQAGLAALLGLGNLSSILTPIRMPTHGIHPRKGAAAGQLFMASMLNMTFSMMSMSSGAFAVAMLFLPWVWFQPVLVAFNIPAALGLAVGLYALCTIAATQILARRREWLLTEIVD